MTRTALVKTSAKGERSNNFSLGVGLFQNMKASIIGVSDQASKQKHCISISWLAGEEIASWNRDYDATLTRVLGRKVDNAARALSNEDIIWQALIDA